MTIELDSPITPFQSTMRDPPPGGNPFVPSAYDLFTQGDMDAWTADLLAKTQRVLKGRDPWAAPPRPPSPLRAETPPAPLYAEEYEGKYEDEEEDDDDDDEEEEEEELFGGVTRESGSVVTLTV